jgi:hypothetical protein
MPDQLQALADLWEWFAQRQCRGYSPLYERISMAVASDTEVLEFVRAAPPAAHMPLALLAAVHYLLLDGYEHPLADVYAGRSDADPVPLFLDVCRTRRDDLAALLAVRRIQTNDCGRSAVIAPGLTWLAGQVPGPLALVDVGASAGLNSCATATGSTTAITAQRGRPTHRSRSAAESLPVSRPSPRSFLLWSLVSGSTGRQSI